MNGLMIFTYLLIPFQLVIAGFIFAGLPYDPPSRSMRFINIVAGCTNIGAAVFNSLSLVASLQ